MKTAFGTPITIEQQWTDLYNEYRSDIDFKQTQAWYLIAECKVKREMTPQQTREWMRENFHFQEIFVDISKLCHRKEHKPKSHNIANIAAED